MGITPPTASTTPPTPPKTKLPETETEKKFFEAIRNNNLQSAINTVLRPSDGKAVPIAELADEDGMTALHWAASNRNIAAMRWLIDKKADLNLADENGRTPLKIALDHKDVRAMTLLIDRKADTKLALPGHDDELKGLTKTSDIVDFMIKTAAADAAKPPPPAVVAPTNDSATTVAPARVEPVSPPFVRRTFGPQM